MRGVQDQGSVNTDLLGNGSISLCEAALLFGPVGDWVSNFDNAGTPRLKDGVEAVDDPHSAGFVGAATADVQRLGQDAAEVFFTPAAPVSKAFGK